jgi:hypothetical protein
VTAPIELAGIVAHSTRIETQWGIIRVQLVVLAEGRKIRLSLPTTLPAEFRKAAGDLGRWIIEHRGRTPEAVDELWGALKEALRHEPVDISKEDI